MDNQHKQIKGYRDLSQAEINLMNWIKAHAEETRLLVQAIRDVVTPTVAIPALGAIDGEPNEPGEYQLGAVLAGHDAGPWRWICLADDHLQQGFMALTRAVAQPTSY